VRPGLSAGARRADDDAMGDANLPWTSFPPRPADGPLEPVRRAAGPGGGPPRPPGRADPAAGRMARVRVMDADGAAREVRRWVAGGGGAIAAPAGWRAWERRHGDALTGAPRVQRLAVAEAAGPAVTLVNWSVPAPPGDDDEAHWRRLLAGPPAPAPGDGRRGGWTA